MNELIQRYFQLPNAHYIYEIEKKLIKIFEESFRHVGLEFSEKEPVVAFGSTTRHTNLDDDLDFDFSVQLTKSSDEVLKAKPKLYGCIKKELQKRFFQNGFHDGKFSDLEMVFDRHLYYFSITEVEYRNYPHKLNKIDVVLDMSTNVNIGLINKKTIAEHLDNVEKDLGTPARNDLLSQIRFTKHVLKQEFDQVDMYGEKVSSGSKEKILEKTGLKSIFIEQILIKLCRKNTQGKIIRIGDFDALMSLIYDADLNYRTLLPETEKKKIIPLKYAQNIPSIKGIKRSETLRELEKIQHKRPLPDYLTNIKESIFEDFRNENKWFLLVKLARDYFEDPEFEKHYLRGIHS